MPFTLTFQKSDPQNTVITREDGVEVYRVITPMKIIGDTQTHIVRVNSGETTVASIRWVFPYVQYTKIALYGDDEKDIATFMKQPKPHAR